MGRICHLKVEKTTHTNGQVCFTAYEDLSLGWTKQVVFGVSVIGKGRSVEDAILHFLDQINKKQPHMRLHRRECEIDDHGTAPKAEGPGLRSVPKPD